MFFCRNARNASAVPPVRVQEEAAPVAPNIDADSIRKNLADLARDKSDADKVLATLLKSTSDNSYEYQRASSRGAQHGMEKHFRNGTRVTDYSPNIEGRPRFDFSETQDRYTHTEQSVHTTRGPLGRTRNHVVQHQVDTIVSEKARLDFNLSEKLDIKVGQNDTVFINGSLQQGHKDIHLLQKNGTGSIAVVLGPNQNVKNVSFDPSRNVATIVLDKSEITVHGVNSPNALLIGRASDAQRPPGFVSATSIAETLQSARAEALVAQQKAALETLTHKGTAAATAAIAKGKEIAGQALAQAQKAIAIGGKVASETVRATVVTPKVDTTTKATQAVAPVGTPATVPTPPKPTNPEPIKGEAPTAVTQSNSTLATTIATLKREQDERRKQSGLKNLREDVNILLEDNAKDSRPATRRELSAAIAALKTSHDNKLPEAEEVAKKIVEARQLARTIRDGDGEPTGAATAPSALQKDDQGDGSAAGAAAAALVGSRKVIPPTIKPPSASATQGEAVKPMLSVKEVTIPTDAPPQPVTPHVKEEVKGPAAKPSNTPSATTEPVQQIRLVVRENGTTGAQREMRTTLLRQDYYEAAMKRISQLRDINQAAKTEGLADTKPSGIQLKEAAVHTTKGAASPVQIITDKQYQDLLSTERLLKQRLEDLSKKIGAVDTLEAKQLKGSLVTLEQSKEYVTDRVKVSAGKKATFDLLADKIKILENWQAQGRPAADLESLRAHHSRIGRSLGYDDAFIKNSLAPDRVSIPVNAHNAQLASDTATAATREVSALEATVSKKWNERLLSTADKFKIDLRGNDWARQNPMKALTATLALSEAVNGALRADYSPEGKHSAIPTLISLMSQDIATWGQFTTKDGGLVAAVAAEAAQKGLDAATVMGGFYALDKVLTNTVGRTSAGQAVGNRLFGTIGGRVLGVAGIAYHGYSTFSDGSFTTMNNTQITGAVASPIVAGAAIGGVLAGPVGAGVGAGAGAVGEGVGIAVGYMRLEGDINNDWKKREVRDSLKFARAGFVHGDTIAASRKDATLSAEATEVIEHQARAAVLSKILADADQANIAALGFKQSDNSKSQAERAAIAEHNWNRMTELTEGRGWYNPVKLYAGNPIDEVKRSSPQAAAEFSHLYAHAKVELEGLYQRAMRVTYTNERTRVVASFEMDSSAATFANKVTSDMSPLEVIGALNQSFPGLPEILKHKNARERLIAQLEVHSGETGRYRRILELDQAVQGLAPHN